MRISDRFILKPDFYNLGELGLDYKDLLTYITIRSFYNSKSKYCYPSYRAISNLSGLSVNFISKSIRRLKNAGLINVWAVGKRRFAYWYSFAETLAVSKVPYTLFKEECLSSCEKAMLILLSEYCKSGWCANTLDEIAHKSGLTHKVIHSHYTDLKLKGFITETLFENVLDGTLSQEFTFSEKLGWDFNQYESYEEPVRLSVEDMFKIYHNHKRTQIRL